MVRFEVSLSYQMERMIQMDNFQLDQQTMDEMTEVLLRRLPDRLQEDFDDLKLVSMDLLCDVKEGGET